MEIQFEISINTRATQLAEISDGDFAGVYPIHLNIEELGGSLVRYVRKRHHLLIGLTMAEKCLYSIGSALPLEEALQFKIIGRNLLSGLPSDVIIDDTACRQAIYPILDQMMRLMVAEIKRIQFFLPNSATVKDKVVLKTFTRGYRVDPNYDNPYFVQFFKIRRLDERIQEVLRAEVLPNAVVEYVFEGDRNNE